MLVLSQQKGRFLSFGLVLWIYAFIFSKRFIILFSFNESSLETQREVVYMVMLPRIPIDICAPIKHEPHQPLLIWDECQDREYCFGIVREAVPCGECVEFRIWRWTGAAANALTDQRPVDHRATDLTADLPIRGLMNHMARLSCPSPCKSPLGKGGFRYAERVHNTRFVAVLDTFAELIIVYVFYLKVRYNTPRHPLVFFCWTRHTTIQHFTLKSQDMHYRCIYNIHGR